MTAETKAFNLHRALSALLDDYKHLAKDTNSEPMGEDLTVKNAEAALFENRPLADWEPAAR